MLNGLETPGDAKCRIYAPFSSEVWTMLLHLNQWRFARVKLRSPLGSDEVCLPIDSQDLEMVGLGGCVLDGLKLELCTILCNAGEMSVRAPPNYGTELLCYCYTRYQISIPLSASQN